MRKQFSISLICVLFVGGCHDPLTKQLKDLGFRTFPGESARVTQHLGDIYNTTDLRERPALSMSDTGMFNDQELADMIEDYKASDITIADSSGTKTYELKTDANIIGKAAVELQLKGVEKFSIEFTGASVYLVSDFEWLYNLQPEILRRARATAGNDYNINNKFSVLSLLRVEGLTYTLYDENNSKIDVAPGGEIEKIVKAKLGAEFSSKNQSSISVSRPSFIGYSLGYVADTPVEGLVFNPGVTWKVANINALKPDDLLTMVDAAKSSDLTMAAAVHVSASATQADVDYVVKLLQMNPAYVNLADDPVIRRIAISDVVRVDMSEIYED